MVKSAAISSDLSEDPLNGYGERSISVYKKNTESKIKREKKNKIEKTIILFLHSQTFGDFP